MNSSAILGMFHDCNRTFYVMTFRIVHKIHHYAKSVNIAETYLKIKMLLRLTSLCAFMECFHAKGSTKFHVDWKIDGGTFNHKHKQNTNTSL